MSEVLKEVVETAARESVGTPAAAPEAAPAELAQETAPEAVSEEPVKEAATETAPAESAQEAAADSASEKSAPVKAEPVESMADYAKELEASYKAFDERHFEQVPEEEGPEAEKWAELRQMMEDKTVIKVKIKEAVKAGADLIISGAGLPVSLPEFVKGTKTRIAPIVSTAKSALVICKMWDRKYARIPDMVVIEGPLAGGHLGFSRDQLKDYGADTENVTETYDQAAYDQEIQEIMGVVKQYGDKYRQHIPVVVAGGIYTREDVEHAMELGADGVQVATRFVTTEECDAPMCYKQAYIDAKEEDIVITKSPVGMPGRAIKNAFLDYVSGHKAEIRHCYQCLEHCDPRTVPYCITRALVGAAEGDLDHALLFCGSNAYRADKIETVDQVMEALVGV